jgi:hypothetical protein
LCGVQLAGDANVALLSANVTERVVRLRYVGEPHDSAMTCVCGHRESAHDYRGHCRVPGCLCESFTPMPQVGREQVPPPASVAGAAHVPVALGAAHVPPPPAARL